MTTTRRVKTQDSLSFDPHAIATTGIKGMELKEKQHQTRKGLIPHLSGSMEIENKGREREERNPHSFNQLVMEQTKVERKETRPQDPNPLVGHHDRVTKSAQGYP
jgi:hypothetical protein